MGLMNWIRKIVFPNSYNDTVFKKYLKSKGVLIGENTTIYSPNHVSIDTRKPWLIRIGDYCSITSGVHIIAHDYSRSVLRKRYGEFIGGSLPVTIGDNVFIGINAVILKGTHIGSDCVIGAGAVVSGHFGDGLVIAGNPAKVICTVEEYFGKCKQRWIDDAQRCAIAIRRNSGRMPTIEDMSDGYAWLYLPHTKETIDKYPKWFELTADNPQKVKEDFLQTKPLFNSFEEFLKGIDFEEKE